MPSKVVLTTGEYDLSHIRTLEELEEEIQLLKRDIKKQGEELEVQIRKLPHQVVKSATDSLLPSFLNGLLSNSTWRLLLSGATMFANPFSKGFSFKKNIVSSAKRLGLITLVKTAYGLWSNRQGSKNKQESFKKPVVNMLNTKRPKKN